MASEGDSAMWLRVEDEDIDEAKLLRVTVNENTTGNGKTRRTSFVCTGTLHKGKDDHMREYSRAQKKVKVDPRNDEDLQLELQRGMMANFRKQKQKRAREEDGDDGQPDDGGEHAFTSSIPPPFILPMLRPRPPSYTKPCAHSRRPFSRIAYLELLRWAARVEEGRAEGGDGEHGFPSSPRWRTSSRTRMAVALNFKGRRMLAESQDRLQALSA